LASDVEPASTASIAFAADRQIQDAVVQAVAVLDARRTRRREVAVLREIRAFPIVDLLDDLGDQEVEVCVALAVRVGGHVERHAFDPGREVGAVVEVEAAQEILVGLAVARMLRDHAARHRLQHFAGAQQRQVGEALAAHPALRGRVRGADTVVVVGGDRDLLRARGGLRRRRLGRACRLRAREGAGQAGCNGDQRLLVMEVHHVSGDV
jgi:hypothetical protein